MTAYWLNVVKPWMDWAVSEVGPCHATGSISTYGMNNYEAVTYTGHVDDQGRACGYGSAIGSTSFFTAKSAWLANELHGFAHIGYPSTGNFWGVETRYGW